MLIIHPSTHLRGRPCTDEQDFIPGSRRCRWEEDKGKTSCSGAKETLQRLLSLSLPSPLRPSPSISCSSPLSFVAFPSPPPPSFSLPLALSPLHPLLLLFPLFSFPLAPSPFFLPVTTKLGYYPYYPTTWYFLPHLLFLRVCVPSLCSPSLLLLPLF